MAHEQANVQANACLLDTGREGR